MNMLQIEESLKHQTQCPKCGADWKEMESSLHESILSDNWHISRLMILNCPVCRMRFGDVSNVPQIKRDKRQEKQIADLKAMRR